MPDDGRYRVFAIVRHERREVELHFFRRSSQPTTTRGEAAYAELFTREEADALTVWVRRNVAGVRRTVVTPGPTLEESLVNDEHPLGATPVKGHPARDFIMFSHAEEWTLPFEAWAYVDLSQARPIRAAVRRPPPARGEDHDR